jgi:hypothetical protein
MPNLITRLINWFILSFNHINTEIKQLSDSWFRKWLWYHWRRIAIQNAAEIKIFSFRDPYEWSWSVIEYLPLVTIETFGADLLWRSKTFDADPRSDHERWTMTTSLLSPHERVPSISVLAGTNEGFEWERERGKRNSKSSLEMSWVAMLLSKGFYL